MSSCAGPKIRRKFLARNLPSLLAANAVIVFTDALQDRRDAIPLLEERKLKDRPPRHLGAKIMYRWSMALRSIE